MEGSIKSRVLMGLFLVLIILSTQVEAQNQTRKSLVPALYVFGDSTADPGNNNHLPTLAKANFPPYGRDFVNRKPTGRFTNGELANDVLSDLLGLPSLLPAYLDPEFKGEKLLTGCSFASAGSGYDDNTGLSSNILTLGKQLKNFQHYRTQLEAMTGDGKNSSKIISEALFVLSTGTNDFVNNYYSNPLTSQKHSIKEYQHLLIHHLRKFIKSIYREGATRLVILALPPFGCLPSQITLHNFVGNTCVKEFNEVARSFNKKIVALTKESNGSFPDIEIAYFPLYDLVSDIVQNASIYGFQEVRRACCGTGLLESSITCNVNSPTCPNATKYVFWDSYHPTSATYNIVAKAVFQQVLQLLGSENSTNI